MRLQRHWLFLGADVMLIFTNRALNGAADESAFERSFMPGSTRLALASVERASSGAGWAVSQHDADVDDDDSLRALLPLFQGNRPVLVYLHGNNNPPAACFKRCDRLAALYGLEMIGFSWASEGFLPDGGPVPKLQAGPDGDEVDMHSVTKANRTEGGIQRKIRRYHQAKTNAQDSIDALARFFRMLGTARLYANSQPFTVAAHSLGAHFLQYTLDVAGAGESLGTAHNVALLAACTTAVGHKDWLAKVRPKGQTFVTYNSNDSVLYGARIADGNKIKLGADPGGDRLLSSAVRYISFTNARLEFGGHGYFAQDKMPKKFLKLFQRIFGSARDLEPGDLPSRVYPMGCDLDGLTCYMAP